VLSKRLGIFGIVLLPQGFEGSGTLGKKVNASLDLSYHDQLEA
jgi:hypothetical protein